MCDDKALYQSFVYSWRKLLDNEKCRNLCTENFGRAKCTVIICDFPSSVVEKYSFTNVYFSCKFFFSFFFLTFKPSPFIIDWFIAGRIWGRKMEWNTRKANRIKLVRVVKKVPDDKIVNYKKNKYYSLLPISRSWKISHEPSHLNDAESCEKFSTLSANQATSQP